MMKEHKFSWLSLALTGTGIGFPVTALCVTLVGGWNHAAMELTVWVIASALFGIISGLMFGKLNLNLPVSIGLHCLCCMAIALTAAAICGYSDDFLTLVKGVAPVFIIIYAAIYVFIYLSMKYEEKKINDALRK